MADKIKLVQGDTRPQVQLTMTDENTGNAVDITGATCRMYFRAAGSTQLLDTLTGIVTNGTGGIVVFPWNSDTLNVDAGEYEGEVEITFPNGAGIQTLYDTLKFKVRAQFA